MDAQTLLDNVAAVADAPDGVKRLRDFVVALAVTGRLLVDSRGQDDSRMGRLGDVVDLTSGQHLKREEYNGDGGGIPYLTGPADFTDEGPVATRWTHSRRAVAVKGDVLLTVKGAGIGKLCVLDVPEAAISRQLMAVRPTRINGPYLRLVLTSLRHRLRSAQVGIAIPGVSRDDVLGCPLALVSSAEQERIVTKVDELMKLCDGLEARQERRHCATARFRRSALHALTEAETPDDLRHAWERVCTNWPALTSHPDSITDLRESMVQLAVEGRLVHREPGDEPALRLLEACQRRKIELVKAGIARSRV